MFSLASFALFPGYGAVMFTDHPDRSEDEDDATAPDVQITKDDDLVVDTSGDDFLNALGGDDQVTTSTGADRVTANEDDSRFGGTGNDDLTGVADQVLLDGGAGNDLLPGWVIDAGGGDDTVTAGSQQTVTLGDGTDFCRSALTGASRALLGTAAP